MALLGAAGTLMRRSDQALWWLPPGPRSSHRLIALTANRLGR